MTRRHRRNKLERAVDALKDLLEEREDTATPLKVNAEIAESAVAAVRLALYQLGVEPAETPDTRTVYVMTGPLEDIDQPEVAYVERPAIIMRDSPYVQSETTWRAVTG